METIQISLTSLIRLYYQPRRAFGEIIDGGSWIFAALTVIAVSLAFQFSVAGRLNQIYNIGVSASSGTVYAQNADDAADDEDLAIRPEFPIGGDAGLWIFDFRPGGIFGTLFGLMIFYVPATILLLTLFAPVGGFTTVLQRDYTTLAACALMAWTAAHLPATLLGFIVPNQSNSAPVLLILWLASKLFFGWLMIFALQTVFGVNWTRAAAVVALSWPALNLSGRIFNLVSPYLFSPFVLIFAFFYLRGAVGSLGDGLRRKQDFRRYLDTAAINPRDAEARVQLGLIYSRRRQSGEAEKYFREAVKIEPHEIDANYELGKIERERGNLPEALQHFSRVAEQNDRYATDEIWREIGATYLAANALPEAVEFLEKFVTRREYDAEGLYLLGEALQKSGATIRAQEMFARCVEAAKTAPRYRRAAFGKWAKLASQRQK